MARFALTHAQTHAMADGTETSACSVFMQLVLKNVVITRARELWVGLDRHF